MSLAENLGRLFEVGFNIGILADIQHQKYQNYFGDLYLQDLQTLRLPTLVRKIADAEKISSQGSIENLERWSQYFIQKGFIAGLNFFREYIKSTNWKLHLRKPEILYYQCSFDGDNAFGSNPKDRQQATRRLLSQFLSADVLNSQLKNYVTKYHKKGEFLQADTLILLRYRREFRIICVDLSIFSIKSMEDLKPLDNIEELRRILMRDIKHIRSKSVFSNLRIDTGDTQDLGLEFSPDLKRYFTAFKRKDKETTKLIQAGAYAYSFYNFLQKETDILDSSKSLLFNAVGYSDRNISSLCLQPKNINILATCAEIYQNEPKEQEIKIARQEVLEKIKLNAKKSFQNGRKFIQELSVENLYGKEDKITPIIHQEKIDGFFNSVGIIRDYLAKEMDVTTKSTLRKAHAELIEKALESEKTYVFFTGNPGIGKTTAIANFLKSHIDEGFLLFYVSPRTQVNLDLINKFKSKKGESLCSDKIFGLTTNSIIIKENNSKPTVSYRSNLRQDNFIKNTVNFLPIGRGLVTKPLQKTACTKSRFYRETEDNIKDIGEKSTGVLYSICQGIYTTINQNISNNIVATVSIQSLRKTPNGADTLKHLREIFKDAYNRNTGVIPEKMQEISQRIKHLFIMIDEVTGDDSGVNFLHGIKEFLKDYDLTNPEFGFNTKVIVADASIVEKEVIQQHLSQTSPEPDKIYFRSVGVNGDSPLRVENFEFNKQPAIAINANSYPASSLDITYKIFLECYKFNEAKFKDENKELIKTVQENILSDINSYLDNPESSQVLVYIQDKQKLQKLIDKISKSQKFEQYTDYLEIHANLSDEKKSKIEGCKQDVKIVFMTSSASRGLSFPKAKIILVEIPKFQIERNLMEVIQVIYRARGEYWENNRAKTLDDRPKKITFYLNDRAIYYPQEENTSPQEYAEEKKLSLAESLLNLWDILLILKLSIMTRITGAGSLGMKKFMMIPIGGKSVSAAGDTFSSQVTNLIRELKNEYRRHPKKQIIKDVYSSLMEIFSSADFVLLKDENKSQKSDSQYRSYLSLMESFNQKFSHYCQRLDKLLNFGNIETGYLTGNLLVVPISKHKLEETYLMKLESQIRQFANQDLVNKMKEISRNEKNYPPNIISAMKGSVLEFVELLKGDINRTQWFEQNSQNLDQYYALPLFVFMSRELMSEYFKQELEEEEEKEFRTLLSKYVHYLYPAYNTLPIGRKYREFPFIVFRSYSLEEMREKIYSDRYLLTSNELNILNLILCRDEKD
ncbi:helicase-related protein [Dapis sp. BLCC M172]|uniref:helicase-related protein n=1 Tax=Dapis sp. BLCC M172 TaxID=2975281 RepID=UPI003CF77061